MNKEIQQENNEKNFKRKKNKNKTISFLKKCLNCKRYKIRKKNFK